MISFLQDNNQEIFEPCRKLNEYYNPWIDVINNLAELNSTKDIIEKINNLPLLNLDLLDNHYEQRYAYLVLSMLAQSYIVNLNNILILPKNIAVPLFNLSKELGLPPIITHAGLDLWNWKLKDKGKEVKLENLELLHSFTGSESEATFYLIMTEIEYLGKEILEDLLKLPDNLLEQDKILSKLSITIEKISLILDKMYSGCDQNIFYNQLRLYLKGWEIIFEGVTSEPIKYSGGSAAQSSLIQIFDLALKVSHQGTETYNFLQSMRLYMPKKHRELLEDYENRMKNIELENNIIYKCCLDKLKKFRKKHYGLVYHYILQMQKDENKVIGTGGTDLKSFLNQCIKNTNIKN